MSSILKKRNFFLFFIFLFGSLTFFASAETFFGTLQTGLVELKEYKHPVFLFVPPNYKPDRTYPMIIALAADGESPEKAIEYWKSIAKRKSMLVLAPSNLWPEDTPFKMDEWFFKVKKDVAGKYAIATEKTYLIGREGGGDYAAYLGITFPQEFASAAVIDGQWHGKFEKLFHPQKAPRKQLPMFIAVNAQDAEQVEAAQYHASKLEKKGYPVYLVKLENKEEAVDDKFKKDVLAWLEEKSQNWRQVVTESKKSLKEKISLSIEEFFHT